MSSPHPRLLLLTVLLGVFLLPDSTALAQEVDTSAEAIVEQFKSEARQGVKSAALSTILTSLVTAAFTYTLAIIHAFGVLYFGPWTRRVLNFTLSTLACISPMVFLLLIFAARDDVGLFIVIYLAISIYPLIARQLLNRVFEAAPDFQFLQAKILGHGSIGVFFDYAWPRFLPLTLPFFFLGFIYSLLMESMFSALGLVNLPSGNTWGSLIHKGLDQLLDNPWIVFNSGIAIMITTLIAYACIPVFDRLLSVPKELT